METLICVGPSQTGAACAPKQLKCPARGRAGPARCAEQSLAAEMSGFCTWELLFGEGEKEQLSIFKMDSFSAQSGD